MGFIVNGFQFKIQDQDNNQVTQNNRVCIVSTTKDKHPIIRDMIFGVIIEIWELDYCKFIIPIFKCD